MPVKLCLRNSSSDLVPGVPVDVYSTFETQEEAFAQAVNDLVHANRMHSPQRIEGDDGSVLVDRAELDKAAEEVRAQLETAGPLTTSDHERLMAQFTAATATAARLAA